MTSPHAEDLIALRLKGKEFDTTRLEGKLYLPFSQLATIQDLRTGAFRAAFIQYRNGKRAYVHEVNDLSRMNSMTGPVGTFNLGGLLFIQEQPVEPPNFKDRARLF